MTYQLKNKPHDSFYDTNKWHRIRTQIMKRDNYQDQLELRAGRIVEAQMVHHIFPKETYPEYKYKAWNLISISYKTHELLHNRFTGGLSNAGKQLMNEVAIKQGISVSELVLVIGLAGSGKTTYVRQNLGQGLAYDLDHIAGAFRLKQPHEEYHDIARAMANSMLKAFANKASEYGGRVFIIRSIPTIDLLMQLEPDRIIYCTGKHDISSRKDYVKLNETEKQKQIKELIDFAKANEIPVEMV